MAPCQATGTEGSVHENSQRASSGDRLTQPWLLGVPKPSCQYAACSANPSLKYCTYGTSRKSNSSPTSSPSIVIVTCFVWMRNCPWIVECVVSGSPLPSIPVD